MVEFLIGVAVGYVLGKGLTGVVISKVKELLNKQAQ